MVSLLYNAPPFASQALSYTTKYMYLDHASKLDNYYMPPPPELVSSV